MTLMSKTFVALPLVICLAGTVANAQPAPPAAPAANAMNMTPAATPATDAMSATPAAPAMTADAASAQPPMSAAQGPAQVMSSPPVPDTAANRAKYGGPMSHAGKHTAAGGN